MAARSEGISEAPQIVVTWQNIFDPSKKVEKGIWGLVPLLISNKITVIDANNPFWPDIPRIETEKAKYLFQQILESVFHRDCRQEHSNRQNALSFYVAPDDMDVALIKIDEIISRVGLSYERRKVDERHESYFHTSSSSLE